MVESPQPTLLDGLAKAVGETQIPRGVTRHPCGLQLCLGQRQRVRANLHTKTDMNINKSETQIPRGVTRHPCGLQLCLGQHQRVRAHLEKAKYDMTIKTCISPYIPPLCIYILCIYIYIYSG